MGALAQMKYDGLDPAAVAARLRTPRCLCLPQVVSTLNIVQDLAEEDGPEGLLVLADEQVAGRGRMGRRWHSPRGAGIWLGYLMRPRQATGGGVLALRVGLAVLEAIRNLGAEAMLKWPNDVVVNDRKLAGVLCEAKWAQDKLRWVAIGIGVNIHGPLPAEIAPRAIALEEVLPAVTRLRVLDELIPLLHGLSHHPSLAALERATYARYDWLANRRVVEPVAGTVCGIDGDGALLVQTEGGMERVLGGSVVAA